MTELSQTTTLSEDYDKYLVLREASKKSTATAISRERLFTRIFNERVSLLDNEMFLALIEHEETLELTTTTRNMPSRNLLAITKAFLSHKGLIEIEAQEVIDMLAINSRLQTVDVAVAEWLVYYYLGLDLTATKQRMRSYLFGEILLRDFNFTGSIDLSELNTYRERLDDILKSESSVIHREYILRACVAMFLIHLTIDDIVNAEYYLMKAVERNYDNFDGSLLLKFLDNLLLIQ